MKLSILGVKFSFSNWYEFVWIYKDVFILKEYAFTPKSNHPYILDCGAHIGVSTLFFKSSYPHSRVISFEPDKRNFALLKQNITQNNVQHVETVQAVLLDKDGVTEFYVQKNPSGRSWGNSIDAQNLNERVYEKIKVPATKLSSYIDQPVDLIKLDIEGAELKVLHEIEHKLHLVHTIILELHTTHQNRIELYAELSELLKKHSFVHEIQEIGPIMGKRIHPEDMHKATSKYYIIRATKKVKPV